MHFLRWVLAPLTAIAWLLIGLAPAQAACTAYSGNTSGLDSSAMVGYLAQLCDKAVANPSSVLTRVSDTNAYAQNDLIATNVTAGSVVVPSVSVARIAAGSGLVLRFRLVTNKTSGWDAVPLTARFWLAPPTYTNGDNGAYAVATGAAGYLGKATFTLEQFADGAVAIGVPYTGSAMGFKLAAGQVIYWDLQYTGSASLSPASGQTFTLIPEVSQD